MLDQSIVGRMPNRVHIDTASVAIETRLSE